MKRLFKRSLAMGIITGLCAVGASSAMAAATVCTTIGPNAGSPDITLAVASNFYEPGQDIVRGFLGTTAGSGKTVKICHNASGTLIGEVNASNNPYHLFLSADDVRPGQVSSKIGDQFTYATGVPALWSKIVVKNDLLTSDKKVNKTKVTSLAVADPVGAPYGLAAKKVLEGMGQWETSGSWITQYDNIALTLDAAENGGKKAAFVSWAQVCGRANLETFPGNAFKQNGIQVNYGTTTAKQLANSFKTYLMSDQVQRDLVLTKCYGSTVVNN